MSKEKAYNFGRLLAVLLKADAYTTTTPEQTVIKASQEGPVPTITNALMDYSCSPEKQSPEIDRKIKEIVDLIDVKDIEVAPFDIHEQGSFHLGLWQQRAEKVQNVLVAKEEANLDARWEIRLESDLKNWALQNGGSGLVRSLLRNYKNATIPATDPDLP